ncbi:MAG: tetratricopeptide repeat protein [Actinobacteria bacterium]|nr:tetratricopeptide repeat protein [Actinomycetota bacterium]
MNVDIPELTNLVGAKAAERLEQELGRAARDFADERYGDARRRAKKVLAEVPDLPEARELLGLCQYRLGRWSDAAKELERFTSETGSLEQAPVLADCYRALGRHDRVDEIWRDLAAGEESPEVRTEGRIVAAGSLADRSELASAVRLLGDGFRWPRAPREYHFRRAYALADLYERAAEVPRARTWFLRIAAADSTYLDVVERIDALG